MNHAHPLLKIKLRKNDWQQNLSYKRLFVATLSSTTKFFKPEFQNQKVIVLMLILTFSIINALEFDNFHLHNNFLYGNYKTGLYKITKFYEIIIYN